MNAAADDFDTASLDEAFAVLSRADAREEDLHWEHAFSRERYYQGGLDYEDYAPAYCVGYIGYAQYGGEFEDAERSLCANWERIKGGSRLSWDGALLAIRAAWDRMAGDGDTPAFALQPARPAPGAVGIQA